MAANRPKSMGDPAGHPALGLSRHQQNQQDQGGHCDGSRAQNLVIDGLPLRFPVIETVVPHQSPPIGDDTAVGGSWGRRTGRKWRGGRNKPRITKSNIPLIPGAIREGWLIWYTYQSMLAR